MGGNHRPSTSALLSSSQPAHTCTRRVSHSSLAGTSETRLHPSHFFISSFSLLFAGGVGRGVVSSSLSLSREPIFQLAWTFTVR